MNQIVWLIVLAVCIITEILTLGLTTIWFAGGALVAFFVSLCTDNLYIQIPVFLVVSIGLLIFTRPIAKNHLNNKRTKTNVDSIIGNLCRVTEEIDNFHEKGTAVLNGVEWTARSIDDKIVPVGEKVRIKEVIGVKLIVELAE